MRCWVSTGQLGQHLRFGRDSDCVLDAIGQWLVRFSVDADACNETLWGDRSSSKIGGVSNAADHADWPLWLAPRP